MFLGKTTKDIGNKGEKFAADYLKKQGYKVLKRNFASAHGEIDIIVQNKDFLVFVEVKTRKDNDENFKNYGLPSEAVNKTKQQHIIYTARTYLCRYPTKRVIRFDVIEVYVGDKIKINHIEDAFTI